MPLSLAVAAMWCYEQMANGHQQAVCSKMSSDCLEESSYLPSTVMMMVVMVVMGTISLVLIIILYGDSSPLLLGAPVRRSCCLGCMKVEWMGEISASMNGV